ncbi:LPXTG cell wall anchor domain-containing protein [Vaginisenegalia massiliensis]|uniref:LPXTG cell wall anchor domain-containing protein n=1 Tax=Vaginisenegalia massiliensis TaxID=2058294 RepID=UPI000F536116|nr:LPXTG cell wall anchor domain-containing protein [Vaginisenegalia massiliensis]
MFNQTKWNSKAQSFKVASSCALLLLSPVALAMPNVGSLTGGLPQVYAQAANQQVTINAVAQGDTTVSGTAAQGTTVTVQFADASKETVDTAADGTWKVTVPQGTSLNNGEIVKATAGDPSGDFTYQEVTIGAGADTTTQAGNVDHFIKTDEVKENAKSITGTTSPKGTVTVRYEATGDKWTVDADASGKWSIDLPSSISLKAGETLQVTAGSTDQQMKTETITVVADTQTPATKHSVTIKPVVEGAKSVSGTTSPKATVTVLYQPTGDKVTVDADAQGNWTANLDSSISLKAGEVLGVTSNSTSNEQAYQEATVEKVDGATTEAKAQKNFVKVNPVSVNDKTISGTSTPNATVLVQFDKTGDKVAVDANAKGEWTINVPSTIQLAEGDVLNVTSNSTSNEQAFQQVKVQGAATTQANKTSEKAKLPSTGEAAQNLGVVIVSLLVLGGVLFYFGKKKSENK